MSSWLEGRRRPASLAAAVLVLVSGAVTQSGWASENSVVSSLPTRAVHFRGASIRVPRSWATNRTRCGTALRDTVITIQSSLSCFVPLARDVSYVQVSPYTGVGFLRPDSVFFPDQQYLDSRLVERSPVIRTDDHYGQKIFVPSLSVGFSIYCVSRAEIDAISASLTVEMIED